MIKGIIRGTVTFFLAAIVLLATSGFTVFKHSCLIEKTTEFSIIIPEFNCDHNDHDHDHEAMPHSCCSLPESTGSETCSTDKCCDTDTFIVKLNITVDIQDYSKNTSISAVGLPEKNEEEISANAEEINCIIERNGLPPPLSGKALHIFLQQLNIPDASV